MHFTHYNDDCYIEYVTRVNGPDDKWHDNLLGGGYIHLCTHGGLGGQALLIGFPQTSLMLTCCMPRGEWRRESAKLKIRELIFPLEGGVKIISLMTA